MHVIVDYYYNIRIVETLPQEELRYIYDCKSYEDAQYIVSIMPDPEDWC